MGTREILAQPFAGEGNIILHRLFLLHHNLEHGVLVQLTALNQFCLNCASFSSLSFSNPGYSSIGLSKIGKQHLGLLRYPSGI